MKIKCIARTFDENFGNNTRHFSLLKIPFFLHLKVHSCSQQFFFTKHFVIFLYVCNIEIERYGYVRFFINKYIKERLRNVKKKNFYKQMDGTN